MTEPNIRFVSRTAVRNSWIAAAALSAVFAVAGVIAYKTNREVPFNPIPIGDLNNDKTNDFLYREFEQGSSNLYFLDGRYARKSEDGYTRSSEGKRLASGLTGTYTTTTSDVNNDGNQDITIDFGGREDVLLGDGEDNFHLAPPTITRRR